MDHYPYEVRSQNIYEKFKDCKGFTEPKKDERGNPRTSYHPTHIKTVKKSRQCILS